MIRVILILFLLTSSANADCKYSATADVINDNLVNKNEKYELTADSKLEDVSIAGYKIVHKKVLKEKNGWRTLVLIEYKLT